MRAARRSLIGAMDIPCDRTAVIGYARVSSQDQADHGISLDAQRHRLLAYCEAHGLTLARLEADEGISAKRTTNRPALQRALTALKEGEAKGLVVVKLDRLSRTTADLLRMMTKAERERWELHSLSEHLDTSSPHGRFFITVIAGLAQMEREQISERTKTAMAELRRQGKRTSRFPPFGFRFEGDRVVEEPSEQPLLRRMLELQAEGAGCYRIATVLNEEGLGNPRTGKAWFYGTLRAVLQSAERRSPTHL